MDVKVFPGTNIYDVAEESVLLANTINFPVKINLNGIGIIVRPGNKPTEIESKYFSELNTLPKGTTK